MSMAKEGPLRKLHRRDWPGFLNRVVPNHAWQEFWQTVVRATDPRIRWSAKYVVVCWIIMGWSIQSQLIERFREGCELLAVLFARRRRPGESYQGLVRATDRVGLGVFHQFWFCLRKTIPKRLGPLWHWYGWVVLAVDGSRIDSPRTRRNERALGKRCGAKTHPQWWLTWIVHLPTKLIWDWRQGPGDSSEREHLREMLGAMPQSTLLIADAGFGGFDFLWDVVHAGVDFLVRCGSNTTLLVEGTVRRIERNGQHTCVYLWPKNRRRHKPLCMRLIVLKRRGKRVYLLTNVMESTRLSRAMARELYAARWGIEVQYRGLKQTMDRRKLLAKTPEPGAMELAGNILAIALLMLHAALALGKRVNQLSVSKALRIIRNIIEALRYHQPFADIAEAFGSAVGDAYKRRRSKAARDWPHKKKEQPPGPPKLRRLNSRERAKIRVLLDHATVFG